VSFSEAVRGPKKQAPVPSAPDSPTFEQVLERVTEMLVTAMAPINVALAELLRRSPERVSPSADRGDFFRASEGVSPPADHGDFVRPSERVFPSSGHVIFCDSATQCCVRPSSPLGSPNHLLESAKHFLPCGLQTDAPLVVPSVDASSQCITPRLSPTTEVSVQSVPPQNTDVSVQSSPPPPTMTAVAVQSESRETETANRDCATQCCVPASPPTSPTVPLESATYFLSCGFQTDAPSMSDADTQLNAHAHDALHWLAEVEHADRGASECLWEAYFYRTYAWHQQVCFLDALSSARSAAAPPKAKLRGNTTQTPAWGFPDTAIFSSRIRSPAPEYFARTCKSRSGFRRVADSVNHRMYLDAYEVTKAMEVGAQLDEFAMVLFSSYQALLDAILYTDGAGSAHMVKWILETVEKWTQPGDPGFEDEDEEEDEPGSDLDDDRDADSDYENCEGTYVADKLQQCGEASVRPRHPSATESSPHATEFAIGRAETKRNKKKQHTASASHTQ